jgi:PAS domain S-box-containing protein
MAGEENMPRKLQERLDAAEETLRALRGGEVDAIVASGPDGDRVYTLKGADEAYRLMVQNMEEGALTVTRDGLILFANEKLASILAIPHGRVIGSRFHDFVVPEDADILSALLAYKPGGDTKYEVRLKASGGALVPASLSVNLLKLDEVYCFCIIVADLTGQKQIEEVLRALSARLMQVQDENQRRIAHGLHDGAFQRLAALEFNLNLIGQSSSKLPQTVHRNLTECLDLVGQCCEDLSHLVYLIQPPLLAEQGFGPALRAYVNGFNRRLGPQVTLSFTNGQSRLPVNVETALFRIVQEALSNIESHSGSATAEVVFRRKRSELLLEIADHGCGISKEILKQLNSGRALPGIGIAGMRERVRTLGGLMNICSSSDGTTVKVRLPARSPAVRRSPVVRGRTTRNSSSI